MVPIEDDEEEYQCHPIRNTLGTRTARSPSMMPNKQERRNEVHVHDTPATRMFRSPSLTSIKQEEDEGQYILDHPSMYVKEEFTQDVHYYSPHGPAQGEQLADGPSPMVNGNRSRQREPLYYDNIIPPMMPKRTMVTIPPKSLPLMKPLLPMSPTPLKSPTPPRSLMSPLPSMWSMWSMPTLPPRSRFSHPIWVHPFTHQCSDGSLREELCWDS
ncbi:MAG: hypothetical protein JOS17DRAFT_468871 [Linnemannia elongata]|nr:MAG: hypothetical protein JOS17DRAFT_468871 [Linnemannia elongata]